MKLTSKLLATAALLTASATAMAHPGHILKYSNQFK